MAQRIGYGVLALLVIVVLVLADVAVALYVAAFPEGRIADLFERGSFIPLTWLGLMLIGGRELLSLVRQKGVRPHAGFAYLMITFLVLAPWLSSAEWLGHRAAHVEGLYWTMMGLLVLVVGAGVLTVVRGNPDGALRDCGATFLVVLYLGFLGSFLVHLRCQRDIPGQQGAWLLLVSVLVTKASDIGGYFAGTLFGRHKLIPSISPAKSVEGALGGMASSAFVALLIAGTHAILVGSASTPVSGSSTENLSQWSSFFAEMTVAFGSATPANSIPPYVRALVFGVLVSIVGQLGDLIESGFKRDVGAKDSGRTMPTYGGILDLIDSPLLATPVAWFLLTEVWKVT